jgi:hypothetical protein
VIGDRRLGRHERRYLRKLQALLVVFPRDERRGMLATVRQNLEDRPRVDSWDRLTHELGPPEAYARQLVHDERALPQPALWRRTVARFPSRWLAGTSFALVVVLVAGGIAYRDWYTHDVHLTDNCRGVTVDEGGPALETSSAGLSSEYVVPFVEEGEFVLVACLSSSETIEVLDVRYPFLFDHSLAEHVSTETATMIDPAAPEPFQPYTLGAWDDQAQHQERAIYTRARFIDCGRVIQRGQQGHSWTASELEVTYRFRGRTHVEQVQPSNATITLGAIGADEDVRCASLPESGAAASPGGT